MTFILLALFRYVLPTRRTIFVQYHVTATRLCHKLLKPLKLNIDIKRHVYMYGDYVNTEKKSILYRAYYVL